MYNGIGLSTPRGSGTSGYVQRNFAAIKHRKEKVEYKTDAELAKLDRALNKPPNKEILEHQWKRSIELKCVELQDELEEQGCVRLLLCVHTEHSICLMCKSGSQLAVWVHMCVCVLLQSL